MRKGGRGPVIRDMGSSTDTLSGGIGGLCTRRSVLRAGAGAALGAVAMSAGVFARPASAAVNDAEFVAEGELRLFAGHYLPVGWAACTGQHAGAPDLRGRAIAGAGRPPSGSPHHVGDHGPGIAARSENGHRSTLPLTYLVSLEDQTSRPLYGEIRAFAFEHAPRGWEVCDGREILIGHLTALFAVIGDAFGGDGRQRFALPDLRGRTPLDQGHGPGLQPEPYAKHRDDLAPGGAGRRPRLHFTYCIATAGEFPKRPH